MNTVSLVEEHFESELSREESHMVARRTALEATLLQQVNSFFAVRLVALQRMMSVKPFELLCVGCCCMTIPRYWLAMRPSYNKFKNEL